MLNPGGDPVVKPCRAARSARVHVAGYSCTPGMNWGRSTDFGVCCRRAMPNAQTPARAMPNAGQPRVAKCRTPIECRMPNANINPNFFALRAGAFAVCIDLAHSKHGQALRWCDGIHLIEGHIENTTLEHPPNADCRAERQPRWAVGSPARVRGKPCPNAECRPEGKGAMPNAAQP